MTDEAQNLIRELRDAESDAAGTKWVVEWDAPYTADMCRRAADLIERLTTETEWEYRVIGDYLAYPSLEMLREDYPLGRITVALERRRKAGPWLPVEQDTGQEQQ